MGDAPPTTSTTVDTVPKSEIAILCQSIDDEIAHYRVRARDRVHYLEINTAIFDLTTLMIPYELIPHLPDVPRGTWTTMHIKSRRQDGTLETEITNESLPGVEKLWHDQRIDTLKLPKIKWMGEGIYETLYQGVPTIMKLANFKWRIPDIHRETYVYSVLDQYQKANPGKRRVTPKFLGHVSEHGRIIGFLLEKLEGRSAGIDDREACEEILHSLHDMGVLHGDINRYNFLVNDEYPQRSHIVDLAEAKWATEEGVQIELAALQSQLEEETGRGLHRVVEIVPRSRFGETIL